MQLSIVDLLRSKGIQPSAQRVAIAEHVLETDRHPSADQVWAEVKKRMPVVSRATVYNTLNLLVEKGLLRRLELAEDSVVFDPILAPHHHFIDEKSGRIIDLPWDALEVRGVQRLAGFEVREFSVVLRGRRASGGRG